MLKTNKEKGENLGNLDKEDGAAKKNQRKCLNRNMEQLN